MSAQAADIFRCDIKIHGMKSRGIILRDEEDESVYVDSKPYRSRPDGTTQVLRKKRKYEVSVNSPNPRKLLLGEESDEDYTVADDESKRLLAQARAAGPKVKKEADGEGEHRHEGIPSSKHDESSREATCGGEYTASRDTPHYKESDVIYRDREGKRISRKEWEELRQSSRRPLRKPKVRLTEKDLEWGGGLKQKELEAERWAREQEIASEKFGQ